MNNRCIINFAKGAWYPRGQQRFLQSLANVGYSGTILAFNDEQQLGCPSHRQIPYGFKVAAFEHAAKLGYKIILWCDAAVWAIRPLDSLFEYIEKNGHVLFYGGHNCAQWTSDNCLRQMNVSRDDAEKMPMYMACCMGLNLTFPKCAEFLQQLTRYAWDGICFPGSWRNDWHQMSHDPRCLGHRHDQSVGSILACQLHMGQIIPHETFFCYHAWGTSIKDVKDSVVMLSQGMS